MVLPLTPAAAFLGQSSNRLVSLAPSDLLIIGI